MKKLTTLEKQETQGGITAMSLSTGVLTVTSILNLILDILQRYWGGASANTPEPPKIAPALPYSSDSPAAHEEWFKLQEFRNYNSH